MVAYDAGRGWLLTADAGTPFGEHDDLPERWLRFLPRYAELQRREASKTGEHLTGGVPDLRLAVLPERFVALLDGDLPLEASEVDAVRADTPRLAALCDELAAARIPDTIQHGDLHPRSVFVQGDATRILDWGDASVGHPFASLLVTFQWLRGGGLAADDPWFGRLRDAYLEPFGPGLLTAFEVAQRVGAVAHALTWLRHYRAMGAGAWPSFDALLPDVLRAARAALAGS